MNTNNIEKSGFFGIFKRMKYILRMKKMLRFFMDREPSWNADPRKITEDLLSGSWTWEEHPEFRQPDWQKNADYSFNNSDVRSQNYFFSEAKKIIQSLTEYNFIGKKDSEIFLETSGRLSANSWIFFVLFMASKLKSLLIVGVTIIFVSVIVILFWFLLFTGRIALKGLSDFFCDRVSICTPVEKTIK